MKVWFTADTHFGHANIIELCNRPFKNLEHMNETLIRNWNERIKTDDTIIFIGDFCFKNTPGGKKGEGTTNKAQFYMNKLNGNKVFIRGNHDNNNSLNTKITGLVMEIGGHEIYCVHNPIDFDQNWRINLCGHIHNSWKIKKAGESHLINVGVDVWNFRPVNIQEILKGLNTFKKEQL